MHSAKPLKVSISNSLAIGCCLHGIVAEFFKGVPDREYARPARAGQEAEAKIIFFDTRPKKEA
jgi:hypothetical protein